jgi:hypothetical protein
MSGGLPWKKLSGFSRSTLYKITKWRKTGNGASLNIELNRYSATRLRLITGL